MGQAASTYVNGSGQARPNRDKVIFPTNIPVRIQLEDGDGQRQPGAYGDQYRYWLTNNQIAWLEPSVHEQIQATTARPFDVYEIVKSETRKGTRRVIAWQVEQIADDAEAAAPKPPARALDIDASAANLAEPGPRLVQPPQERPTLAPQHTAEAQLAECLLAAIRAAKAAEVYAHAQELPVRWTSEDLRSMALSLFIAADRKAGR